jgi:preprotein translocase subunit YajC
MLSSLQAGNEVLTTGGLVGTIVSISDDLMILRIKPDNIKVQIARSAVTGLVTENKLPEKKNVSV